MRGDKLSPADVSGRAAADRKARLPTVSIHVQVCVEKKTPETKPFPHRHVLSQGTFLKCFQTKIKLSAESAAAAPSEIITSAGSERKSKQ